MLRCAATGPWWHLPLQSPLFSSTFPQIPQDVLLHKEHFKLSRTLCSARGGRGLGEGTQGKKHEEKLQDMGQHHPPVNLIG